MQEPNGNYSISFEELSRRQKEILDKQGPVTYEQAKAQVERLKKGSYLRRMKYERVYKEDLKVGDQVEARQCMVNYIRDEKGNVTGVVSWNEDVNEEDNDNHWFKASITQDDLDEKRSRNWGHNDWFHIFDCPLRKAL